MTQTDPPTWHAPGPNDAYQCWSTYVGDFPLEVLLHDPDFGDSRYRWEVRSIDTDRDPIAVGGELSLGAAQQAARGALIDYAENVAFQAKRLTCEAKPIATRGVRVTIEENP